MKIRRLLGRKLLGFAVSLGLALGATWFAAAHAQIPGNNVNMVSGNTLPGGDPFLQRQNEPSGAVSTRNPLHVLAGANDYRTVDLPGLPDELDQDAADEDQAAVGDAWLGVFKSFDGGSTWRSTLIPGYPQDTSPLGLASPLKGFEAGADPTVRAGSNGLFYYSGIYFNRGEGELGVVAVSRFIDNNNAFGKTDDPIAFLGTTVVDRGTRTRFIDKPYLIVDVPRPGARTCTISSPGTKAIQRIPAGTVYLAYVVFTGTEEHPYSIVYVKRSLDCGVTWSAPAKVSEGGYLNQGVTMAIDPASGRLYVAWRKFADRRLGDAIMFVRTRNRFDDRDDRLSRFDRDRDRGLTEPLEFTDQRVFALTKPFDQGMTETTFRTTAYPTMTVDAGGRLYVAWSERGLGPAGTTAPTNADVPSGDARIVMVTSRDGQLWTGRRGISHWARPPTPPLPRWKKPPATATQAIENENVPGHQIMPVLTNVGGKITLMYYDLREDVSQVFKQYVNDAEVKDKRHTIDVRVSQADPADDPVFQPSIQVSHYQFGVPNGQHLAQQLQYNVPNLPLYGGGMLPFIGDYIDIAGQTFVQDAGGAWRFNVAPGGPTVLQAFWTDNRDVRPPLNRDWTQYTPVTSSLTAVACVPGNTGMRNSNIYTSKISQGLVVGSFANAQRLSPTVQRSFVVFAENSTEIVRRYRFSIANQPAGGRASFLQFSKTVGEAPLTTLDATIPPRSTAARTVYVRSTDPLAKVVVEVAEVQVPPAPTPAPPLVSGGFTGTIILNPDVINPDVINPDVINASTFSPALSNPDVINPDVINMVTRTAVGATAIVTPDVINPDVINPDVINPDVINPDVINVVVANPDVINPDVINPDVINPTINNSDLLNPDVINPDVINPDVINGTLVDATWAVQNTGNALGTFSVKTLLTQAAPLGVVKQLLLYKTYATPVAVNTTADGCVLRQQSQTVLVENIPNPDVINPDVINPDVINPDVINPDVINPDVINAQLALAPGETGKITLRVFAPSDVPTRTVTVNGRAVKVPFNTATNQVWNPAQVVVPVVVANTVDTVVAQTIQPGQTPPLPPVALVATTTSLPDGTAGNTYTASGQPIKVTAVGGTGVRTWSIVPGSGVLPPGMILNPATGVISGTPTQAGSFRFVAHVVDAATPPQSADVPLSILVAFAIGPQVVATEEDTAVQLVLSAPGVSQSDPQLSFVITTPPAHGSVSNTLLYTPAPNYNGADSFAFNATLQTAAGPVQATGTATATVRPVNDAPSTTPQSVSTSTNTPLPITLAGTDLETTPNNLSFAIATGPAHGVLSGGGGNRLYTPNAGYSGPDSFTFTVTDRGDSDNCGTPGLSCSAALTSAPATVSINVSGPGNQPPVFDVGSDQVAAENSGPHTVTNWAIGSPGAHTAVCPAGVTASADGFVANGAPSLAFDCSTATNWTRGDFIGTLTAHFSQPTTFRGLRLAVNASPTTNETYAISVSDDGATWTPLRTVTHTVEQGAAVPTFDILLPRTTANYLRIHVEDSLSWIAINEVQTLVSSEDTQQLSYVLQNDSPGLFSAQPQVDPSGTLTFTPAPNAFGVAHLTAYVQDDGGGTSASPAQPFVITVNGTPGAIADIYTTAPDTPFGIKEQNAAAFNDFTSTSGLVLNGSAAANYPTTTGDGTVLRLTTTAINQSASVYTSSPVFIKRFSTSFTFRITPPSGPGSGGDGFTFAIQPAGSNPNILTQHDGGDLGYGGIDHSVAIEFDTFSNPQHVDPAGHHIGIDLNGKLHSVQTAAVPGSFDDGQLWRAWIDYDGVTLEVRVNNTDFRPAAPALSRDINIPAIVGGANAYVGFTAATGTVGVESTDITSWTYTPYTLGLLANDTDPEGDGIRAVLDTGPSHGTLDFGSNGAFLYTPNAGFIGSDTFTYHAFDGLSSSMPATVVITVDSAPVAVADIAAVTSGTSTTIAPAANDTDADNASPSIATARSLPPGTLPSGTPNLAFPNEMAVVPSTGLAYFATGSTRIGILDTTTNTIVGSIAPPNPTGFIVPMLAPTLFVARVNASTQIVYFRTGNQLIGVDGRPASPTFNTVIYSETLGNAGVYATMAIDEAHQRLYVLNQTGGGGGSIVQMMVTAIDVDPASPTFHQAVANVALPGVTNAVAIAVNAATNKVYVGTAGGATTALGVAVIDGATLALSMVSGTPASTPISQLAVNDATNIIYATTLIQILAIDGATSSVIKTITATGVGGAPFASVIDQRLVVHLPTGRVYAKSSEYPDASHVVVVDGNPSSPTYNTQVDRMGVGRDLGVSPLLLDRTANRLITTADADLTATVMRVPVTTGQADTIAGVVSFAQPSRQVAVNPATHRAYVSADDGFVTAVDLATAATVTTVPTGAEVGPPVVMGGVAYAGRTGTVSNVAWFDTMSCAVGCEVAQGTQVSTAYLKGRTFFVAKNSTTNKVYALNSRATAPGPGDGLPSFVSVIDGTTHAITATLPIPHGNFGFGLGVNEVTNKIYVGSLSTVTANGTVIESGLSVIDGATNTITQADLSAIPLAAGVTTNRLGIGREIVVNPTTGKVYFRILFGSSIGVNGIGGLGVLDPATNHATALSLTNVFGVAVDPVLNRVYVMTLPNTGGTQIHVLDGATDTEPAGSTITLPIPANGRGGFGAASVTLFQLMAASSSTGRVFSVNYFTGLLFAVDGATRTLLGTAPVGDGAISVAVNNVTNRVYVGSTLDRTLTIVNALTLKVERKIQLPLAPALLTVDEANSRVIASSTAPFEPGVMLIDDPASTNGTVTVTSVGQGTNGTVALNANGTVTYTPNNGFTGSDSYQYTVTDSQGGSSIGTVNVTVTAPLSITTPTQLPNGTVGSLYTQTFAATGGSADRLWTTSGPLPSGLTLSSAGVLSGTLGASGTFTFNVSVNDATGFANGLAASQTFTLAVGPMIIVTGLPTATINTFYSQQLNTGGSNGAVTWTLDKNNSPLLSWLSLSSSGLLSGTPPQYGSTPSFTVTATDATNQVASRAYSLFVSGPLEILTPLQEGIVLENPPALQIVGGSGARTATLTGGALPPGVALTSSGGFTGQPMRHGTFNFSVQVTDSSGTINRNLAWRVSAKDQQGGPQTQPTISFGGSGGRRLAQTLTVGAAGTLTGMGFASPVTCSLAGPVTIEVQRLTLAGLPDGTTIATGSTSGNLSAIAVSPALEMPINAKLALIMSSPTPCTIANVPASDLYQVGDAYSDSGSGWVSLFSTDGRYDIPFRTLIQPAMNVAYLNRARGALTATVLYDGKVLLTGNDSSAELYSPAANTSLLTGSMSVARRSHTETLLGNGTVLVTGGFDLNGNPLSSAEIFDPGTGLFSLTTGTMTTARASHMATRLNDGRVLLTGGVSNNTGTTLSSAEIFDPLSQTFSAVPNMTSPRQSHTSTLLQSGKVLVAGGFNNTTTRAEIFDAGTTTFTPTTGEMVVPFLGQATATLLNDGKVLIAGGTYSGLDLADRGEIYDPLSDDFTATAGTMVNRRISHTAALLPDGSVLLAGGDDQPTSGNYIPSLATMERFIPASGIFLPAGGMEARRHFHASVALPSGKVFIVGGFGQSWMTGDTGELYEATVTPALATTSLPDGQVGTPYQATALTATGGAGGPYSITHVSGLLPGGLSYSAASSTLSGTPGAGTTGVYSLGFNVTDSASNSNTQALTLRVGNINLITSPYRLTDGVLGLPYDVTLASSGSSPVVWSAAPGAGVFPPGVSLDGNGHLTGTPTATGFFTFVVREVDATGQLAVKTHAIFVQNPLQIATTSLTDAVLFDSPNNGCLSANFGIGNRTWSVIGGALPPGISLLSSGCFTGQPTTFGNFNFTVKVTDEYSPAQSDTKLLSLNVLSAVDQIAGSGFLTSPLNFSSGGRIGERVYAGVSGRLRFARLDSLVCPVNTLVTAEIQGLTGSGRPDGNMVASGSAIVAFTSPFGISLTIPLSTSPSYAADAGYAVVFSANAACSVVPGEGDSYPGQGFVFSSSWQPLVDVDVEGRDDIPFEILVEPIVGLSPLKVSRGAHTATQLQDGRVLLAGSDDSAELYNPVDGSSTATGSMGDARANHTATLLGDGTVLILGGTSSFTGAYLSSAELFHPDTGAFETLSATMSTGRTEHTATLLADGRVFIAGGFFIDLLGTYHAIQTAQIYNPSTRTFSSALAMLGARDRHTATLLGDGRVLLVGGFGTGPSAEIFNPSTSTFTATSGSTSTRFAWHTATRLADGRVFLGGGADTAGFATSHAEIFDSAGGGTFTSAGSLLNPRLNHTATLLPDGSVLIAGGSFDVPCCSSRPRASMERYQPGSGFSGEGSLVAARYVHAAAALVCPASTPGCAYNGKVLLSGTFGPSLLGGRSDERYDPATAVSLTNGSLPIAHRGVPYAGGAGVTLSGHGGAGPYTIAQTSGTLPAGLAYNATTHVLSGTPGELGTFELSFTITDSVGRSNTQALTLLVQLP